MRPYLFVPLLLSGVLFVATIDDESGFPMWLGLRSDLETSRVRIEELRLEIEALRSEVEALRNDPFALEKAIREDLEFARPGETVVRFVGREGDAISRLR